MVRKDLLRQLRSPMAMSWSCPRVSHRVRGAAAADLRLGRRTPSVPTVSNCWSRTATGACFRGLLVSASSQNEQMAEYFDIESARRRRRARDRCERGEASALLVIPEGFGQRSSTGRARSSSSWCAIRRRASCPRSQSRVLFVLAEVLSSASRVCCAYPLDPIAAILEADSSRTPVPASRSHTAIATVTIYDVRSIGPKLI